MKIRFLFSVLLPLSFCFFGSLQVQAQTPSTTAPTTDTTKYLVVKYDGNEYVGLILSDDGREVLIETKSLGKIYIPKSDIKSMRPIDYAVCLPPVISSPPIAFQLEKVKTMP
jgi:hypothetical protein